MNRSWIPLAVGVVLVPAALTAFGFTVYGDELTHYDGATITAPRIAVAPAVVLEEKPPAALPPSPQAVQRSVSGVFAAHAVKGITFAPGTTEFVGRGGDVQRAVGAALRPVTTAAVTLVAHAWNGETASHRCDVLAMERAGLVRDYLLRQGVPPGSIRTRVVVDPVWGPPSEGGPQVDVIVS
ncbi:hypothetical protein Lesp02_75880 [Lentzea sp. NBRC 105346]|uniref:hypothetical protein n=1 Tax=Lentzea sp. NBRC 105346 TaxID=3032205 RepID=UPI0024A39F18|nr:hypothetical protein [Lentzea sp. NBRC 105346]GLZ35401.1 hypothetical protein Lesp02_75880 [Lentzea sp. NBRC 105346]